MDSNRRPKVWNGIFRDITLRAIRYHRFYNVSHSDIDFGSKSNSNTRKGSIKNTETLNLTPFFSSNYYMMNFPPKPFIYIGFTIFTGVFTPKNTYYKLIILIIDPRYL